MFKQSDLDQDPYPTVKKPGNNETQGGLWSCIAPGQVFGSGFKQKNRIRVLYLERRDFFSILFQSFLFHTFSVRSSIDVLDPENQPGFGKIRTGFGSEALGLTEDV